MTTTPQYPAGLQDVLARANLGDAGAVPELHAAFDRFPELVERFGDLAAHAEMQLLGLAAGASLVGKEAISRQLADLRARLTATASTELERLLATQLSLDWLGLQHAQLALAGELSRGGGGPAAQLAERRLDRAHARLLATSKTAATVAKLLRRAPSPLELLRPAGEAAVSAGGGERKAAPGCRPEVVAGFG